jgi:hypothetical protein
MALRPLGGSLRPPPGARPQAGSSPTAKPMGGAAPAQRQGFTTPAKSLVGNPGGTPPPKGFAPPGLQMPAGGVGPVAPGGMLVKPGGMVPQGVPGFQGGGAQQTPLKPGQIPGLNGAGQGAPPPPASQGEDQSSSVMDEMEGYYQDLLGEDAADWEKKQEALRGEMAGYGRQADLLNSRMGHSSISGGYASLSGAALGKGMEAFNEAEMAHSERRRQLQLEYMGKKIEEARRQEERGWQQEDQSEDQWMQAIEWALTTDMAPGDMEEFMSMLDTAGPEEAMKAIADGKGKQGSVSGDAESGYTYNNPDGETTTFSQDQWEEMTAALGGSFQGAWRDAPGGIPAANQFLLDSGWKWGEPITEEQLKYVEEHMKAANYDFNRKSKEQTDQEQLQVAVANHEDPEDDFLMGWG